MLYGEFIEKRISTSAVAPGEKPAQGFTPTRSEAEHWRKNLQPDQVSSPGSIDVLRVMLPSGATPIELQAETGFRNRFRR